MDFSVIFESLPRFWVGALLTLQVTFLSVGIGLICSVPIALMRLSRNPFIWMPTFGYMFYFRGTPLLVQLFLVYYGSGQFVPELRAVGLWTFFREPYFCAVFTLTLNTAAYTAEILRGAIQAVPVGEVEAGKACGMGRWLLLRRIVLPKAARLALPAYSNEVIFLFQATSLISIITLMDLTGIGRVLIAKTLRPFEIWIFLGAIYLALSYGFLFIFKQIEYRLYGHLRDRPDADAQPEKAAPTADLAVR